MLETLQLPNKLLATGTALALGASALFAGCGKQGPEVLPNHPGVVVGHRYDDPDEIFSTVGKVSVVRHDKEHFYLDIQQCDRPNEASSDANGCVTATTEVTESTYWNFRDGDTIAIAGTK